MDGSGKRAGMEIDSKMYQHHVIHYYNVCAERLFRVVCSNRQIKGKDRRRGIPIGSNDVLVCYVVIFASVYIRI